MLQPNAAGAPVYISRSATTVWFARGLQMPNYEVRSRIVECNNQLKELYRVVSTQEEVTEQLVATLDSDLDRLAATHGDLSALPDYGLDGEIRHDGEVYRAVAWLHAWATFSLLASRASTKDLPVRARMLRVDATFGRLLTVYEQMRSLYGTDEPLRGLLGGDGTNFILMLSYVHAWPGPPPEGVHHHYYFPSIGELVGTADAEPAPARDVFGLWGLVNLQLDTWPGCVEWLEEIAACERLTVLDGTSRNFASELRRRVRLLAQYMRLRNQLASPAQLKQLVDRVSAARSPGVELPDEVTALARLATPIAEHDRLWDAELLLRYVLLLAFKGLARVAVDRDGDTPAPSSFDGLWQDSSKHLPPPARVRFAGETPRAATAVVRWGQLPAPGHFTRIAYDVCETTLTWLEQQAVAVNLEREHLASLRNGRWDFAATKAHLRRIEEMRQARIAPYDALNDPDSPLSLALAASATAEETERVRAEVALLRETIDAEVNLRKLVRAAYELGDSTASALALSTCPSPVAAAAWSIHAVPRAGVDYYRTIFRDAKAAYATLSHERAINDDLKARFDNQQLRVASLRERWLASRAGELVATATLTATKLRRRMAELDVEITDLGAQMARLEKDAAFNTAAGKRQYLAVATRWADLASCQVEALQSSAARAAEIATQAIAQLDQLRDQALEIAAKIVEQKRHDAFMSIVNAVVTVVGLVLAPFTGGGSLTVANLVAQGIKLVDKLSRIDWSNIGVAIGEVVAVANDVLSSADIGLKAFGVKAPKALADMHEFLADPLKGLDDSLKPVLDGLRDLPLVGDVSRIGSALASGFPLAVNDAEQVSILCAKDCVRLAGSSLDAITEPLRQLFKSGAIWAAPAATRAREVSTALALETNELGERLKGALDSIVKQYPDEETLQRFGNLALVKADFAREKDRLLRAIETLPREAMSTLGHLIGTGALFVSDAQDRVVALQRQLVGDAQHEAERFRARLQNYKAKIENGVIKETVDKLTALQKELSDKVQRIVDSNADNRDEQLQNLARTEFPTKVQEIKDTVEALKSDVTEAEGELIDKKDLRSVAAYDNAAAEALAARSEVDIKRVDLMRTRSTIGVQVEDELSKAAEAQVAATKAMARAESLELELAMADLRRTYLECVRRGIDPLAAKAAVLERTAPRIADVLDSGNDPQQQSWALEMAEAAMGYLRWLQFLGMPASQGASKRAEWYATILDALSRPDDRGAVGKLDAVVGAMDRALRDARLSVEFPESNLVRLSDAAVFTWLPALPARERDVWVKQWKQICPLPSESYLAAFRVLFSPTDPGPAATRPFFKFRALAHGAAMFTSLDAIQMRWLADTNASLLTEPLAFLLVPPEKTLPKPGAPLTVRQDARDDARLWPLADLKPIGKPRDVVYDLAQILKEDQIRAGLVPQLAADPLLVGIYGEWRGMIVAQQALTPEAIESLRENVKVMLYMAEIQGANP